MEVECCEILVVDDHPIVLEGIKKIASALEGVKCDGIMEVEQLELLLMSLKENILELNKRKNTLH